MAAAGECVPPSTVILELLDFVFYGTKICHSVVSASSRHHTLVCKSLARRHITL